jgi:NAD(P)H-flavin reductase
MRNPYLPLPMRIERVVVETDDRNIKTFSLSFLHEEDEAKFTYIPGQFAELSVLGEGEAPFGMASSPTQPGRLEFTVSKAGVVTIALHNMEPGEIIGIRGPLGNGYPIETFKGKNIVIIGGGFGFSTLRALTNYMLDSRHRNSFGDISIFYGARSPGLLLYRDELQEDSISPSTVGIMAGRAGWGSSPQLPRKLDPALRMPMRWSVGHR